MAITEDDLAQALVRYHKESQEELNKTEPEPQEVRTFLEAHYNDYGNRGVADLYVTTEDWDGQLYELKSESAVRGATGANEIIRQFNKMREFFFSGSQHKPPQSMLHFELCFAPSEYNLRHVAENADLYAAAVQQDMSGLATDRILSTVTIRPPNADNITPINMLTNKIDFRTYPERSDENKFLKYVKDTRPTLFKEHEEILREIVEEAN